MILAHIRSNFAAAFFPRISEWVPAAVMILLGYLLSASPDLMTAEPVKPGYALLLLIGPQSFWVGVFYAFGVGRSIILLINGAWRRSPWARAACAALSMFLFGQIMASFSTVAGYAFALAAGFTAMDFINIFRAMRDARTVDDAYRAHRQRAHEHA